MRHVNPRVAGGHRPARLRGRGVPLAGRSSYGLRRKPLSDGPGRQQGGNLRQGRQVHQEVGGGRLRAGPDDAAQRNCLRFPGESAHFGHPQPPNPEVHQGRAVPGKLRLSGVRRGRVRPALGHRRGRRRQRLRRRLGQQPRPETHGFGPASCRLSAKRVKTR